MTARITALAALLAVTLAGGFLAYKLLSREHAQDTADVFVKRWSSGNDASAARVTDDPQAAAAALKANRAGLDGAKLKATLGDVKESGDAATATLSLRWQIPRIGGWRYDSKLRLRRSGDEWKVRWSPKVVHPKLDADTRLGTTSVAKARGQILDRDRRPLMREQRVVRVGAVAGKVKRPAVTARGLADVLDVDAAPLERAIREGGKEQFVDAIVMRPSDYRPLRAQIEAVPDAETADGTAMLAPSREFARALLGSVGPRDEGAAREARRPRRARRVRWPVGPAGALRAAARAGAVAAGGDPGGGRPGRDAAQPRRAPGSCGRDHARPAGPGRGGGGALRHDGRGRARGGPALDRRRPGGRQPPGRVDLQPRASRARTRPAPPSRSSRPRRCCATGSTSATRSSARPRSRPAGGSSRTSRAARPGRSRSAATSRCPATPRSCRSRPASPPTR